MHPVSHFDGNNANSAFDLKPGWFFLMSLRHYNMDVDAFWHLQLAAIAAADAKCPLNKTAGQEAANGAGAAVKRKR